MAALEARHLADLRVPEVTRALRALSSAYVERRRQTAARAGGRHVHGALDTAGKRAAFALFYAPLHFIAVSEVVRARGAGARRRRRRSSISDAAPVRPGLHGRSRRSRRHPSSASIATRGRSMKRDGRINS